MASYLSYPVCLNLLFCVSCGGGVCSGGVVDSVGAVGSGCVLCG